MTKILFPFLASAFLAQASIAAPLDKLGSQKAAHESKSSDKPMGCAEGFVQFGTIMKIEISKKGLVAETVRMKGGAVQKMPPFKPTELYNNKVGDAFCIDTTPDND